MNRTCLDGSGLELYNVGCLGAFGRVDNVERDILTFGQGFESAVLNVAEMNEYIAAIFASNETKTLGIIEPLYCTIFHDKLPPSCKLKLTEKAKKSRKANVCAVTLQVHPVRLKDIMPRRL